jgi:signal transduction histidine kinase
VFRSRGTEKRLIAIESIETELEARTLEAWVDMARVLAHEIMSSLTPVASLSATAAQLLRELETRAPADLSGPDREALAEARLATETAARRGERLMTFVQRYRELAQLPAQQPAPLDAVELVQGVATLLRAELAASGTALAIATPASALPLRGDRGLLEQALINLVRNAADAVRGLAGARVWLTVGLTVDDRIAIEVADNGPGIDRAMADQIFVPFFTTKPAGSGIGLTVAQHVAHVHHGSIRLAERPGGGAAFTLVL